MNVVICKSCGDVRRSNLVLFESPPCKKCGGRDFYQCSEYEYETMNKGKSQSNQAKKKDGCFIATAAYGSALMPEVIVLSKFRDERLKPNRYGRLLVHIYEGYSPPLANWIEKHSTARKLVRSFLLSPILWLVKRWK